MNILILGSGGRESAFAWKIAQSSQVEQLYIAPGNGGTDRYGINVDLQVNDFKEIANFSLANSIDIIVVGPEEPLVNGIHDYFLERSDLNKIAVIGPQQAGAQLEGSKRSEEHTSELQSRENLVC